MISAAYLAQQRHLHENDSYGVASVLLAPVVKSICEKFNVQSLIDYGCGKGRLFEHLPILDVHGYDPAIEKYSVKPSRKAQLVTCIDVLEHIEPEYLDAVLDDIASMSTEYYFLTVNTGPAYKVLSDGRNAHLIQEPLEWWLPKFWARMKLQQFNMNAKGNGFLVFARVNG